MNLDGLNSSNTNSTKALLESKYGVSIARVLILAFKFVSNNSLRPNDLLLLRILILSTNTKIPC